MHENFDRVEEIQPSSDRSFGLALAAVLPIGLLMRIFVKSTVAARRNRNAESYWIRREIPGPPADTMTRQF
jgi:hypothetical protein